MGLVFSIKCKLDAGIFYTPTSDEVPDALANTFRMITFVDAILRLCSHGNCPRVGNPKEHPSRLRQKP